MYSSLGIVLVTQDERRSDQDIRTAILQSVPDAETAEHVRFIRVKDKNRAESVNACLNKYLNDADAFAVIDTDRMSPDCVSAALQYIRTAKEDVCFCCGAVPNADMLNAHRNRYVRYLCENAAFRYFSPDAVRRMRTSDTTDLMQETLSDETVSVSVVLKEIANVPSSAGQRINRLIRSAVCVRSVLTGCAGASLAGSVLFLLLFLLRERSTGSIVGCIVCAHVFLFCLGGLLIRWYHASANYQKKARTHPYVDESIVS